MSSYADIFFEMSDDLFAVMDKNCKIIYANSVWQSLLRWPETSLIGADFCKFLRSEEKKLFDEVIKNVALTHETQEFSLKLKMNEGSYLFFESRIAYQEEKEAFVFYGKNQTDFLHTNFLLNQIENISQMGYWEFDMETKALYWSDVTFKIHEVDPLSFRPDLENALRFYLRPSRIILENAMEKMMETGEGYDLKLQLVTEKGRLVWVRSISKTEVRNGKVLRCYGCFQDITEHSEKEEKIKEDYERFNAVVSNIPIMISIFDEEGNIEWINNKWNEELGWDLQSVKGRDMVAEFYPDESQRQKLIDFVKEGRQDWQDLYTRTKMGTYIHTSWANIRLANGKMLGIGQNINERKKLEQSLKKTNHELSLAMQIGKLGVWEYSVADQTVTYTKDWCDIFGYDFSQVPDKLQVWEESLHPDHYQKTLREMNSCLQGSISSFEDIHQAKTVDGKWLWVHMRGQVAERAPDGQPLRFTTLTMDITEQQNLEEELKRVSKESEKFYSVSLDPMCVVSFDGYIKRINPAFKQAFGYEEAELTSRSILELLHPQDINYTVKELDKLSKGQRTIRFENQLKTKAGDYRILNWSVAADKETEHLYCAIRDLTKQRSSELKLLQSAKMATLGEMAGGIAHEINNPLAIIQGKAALLIRAIEQEKIEKDKLKSDLQKITDTADRIAKIIRGLRSFSRDSEKDPMMTVDLRLVIQETIDLCAEKFKNYDIKLKTDLEENLKIQGRFTQLGQILINLLNNSFDAVMESSNEKWISIEAKKIDNKIYMAVVDSGAGISEEVANRMMNPFFTTKEVGKGTGLGLSISKGIVEDHKGILYYDEKSLNTRFVIELPAD